MAKTGINAGFKYDANGLRIQKTVNGVVTDYTLHGKLITHLKQGGTNLQFFYDPQSRPAMVNFNGTLYTYVHNLQGDIVAIVDSTGAKVVEYKYDAWGKPLTGFPTGTLANTLGKLNPFRYRGYVYDEETALYYLRSRYYNPEWGRFLNEDVTVGTEGLLSHNMFAYCLNAPINMLDADGAEPVEVIDRTGGGGLSRGSGGGRGRCGGGGSPLPFIGGGGLSRGSGGGRGGYPDGTSIVTADTVASPADDIAQGEPTGSSLGRMGIGAAIIAGVAIVEYVGSALAAVNATGLFSGNQITLDKIGKLVPDNHPNEGYYGVRYKVLRPGAKDVSTRSIEFHTHPHKGYNPHWQLNVWNSVNNTISKGKAYWTWFFRRIS